MAVEDESTDENVHENDGDNDPEDSQHAGHGQDDAIDNESGDQNEKRATKKMRMSESNDEGISDSGSDDESWQEESEEEEQEDDDDNDNDNDNDEEPVTGETSDYSHATNQHQRLTWRMDPKESFSDWTVLVIKNDGTNQTYHVHKHALVIGTHRSEYFALLFRNDAYREHVTNTSEIHLQDLAAEAFPLFLDLFYDHDIDVDEHVVALYHLASFFQVDTLMKRIKQEVLPQVCLQNACRIYSDAINFEPPMQVFVDCVEKACINSVLEIHPSSPILNILRPESFLALLTDESHLHEAEYDLETPQSEAWWEHMRLKTSVPFPGRGWMGLENLRRGLETPPNISRHLSKLVASYCQLHDIDADTFDHLTREYVLPVISLNAAQNLIALQEAIVGATPSKMSESLEQRCCAAFLDDWDKIDLEDSSEGSTLQFLMNRPSKRYVETMSALISRKNKKLQNELEETTAKLTYEFSRKNKKLQNELQKTTAKLTIELEEMRAKLTNELEETRAKHLNRLADYKDQISELKQQLNCFHSLTGDARKKELKREYIRPPHQFSTLAKHLPYSNFSYEGHALYYYEAPEVESDYKLKRGDEDLDLSNSSSSDESQEEMGGRFDSDLMSESD